MIELPSDLAEVLKVVQSNEHGSGILFPDANEDLLSELAAAWEAWNSAAEPAVRTIVASANRAMANMSGAAAESFEGYLRKYAGSDQSHAATTLDAGAAMAQSLRGAQQAVTQTKSEMVRELQYAKDYMEQNPAGKHDDIAQSEGIKTAADTYNTYVGQVGSSVDSMLRQSAGHVERMTGAGQVARLGGSNGGAASPTGTTAPGAALDPSTLLHPTATGLDSLSAPVDPLAGAAMPGAPAGTLSAPGDPSTAGLPSGAAMPGGFGAAGGSDGGSGGGSGAYRPQLGSLQPFQPPSPAAFTGGSVGGGGSFGSGGGGAPVFSPDSTPHLSLAGLPGFTGSSGSSGGAGGGSGTLAPWSPPTPGSGTFGGSGLGPGGLGGLPLGGLGGGLGGGAGAFRPGSASFKPSVPGGGAAGGRGLAGGMPMAGGGRGFGGGGSGLGGGAGRGLSARSGLGVAGGGAEGSARVGGAGSAGVAGSGVAGRAGTASGSSRGTGSTGMAGAHGPGGMMGGGGRGDKRGGNRFVRPTRFGAAGPEDEEEMLLADSGITGQAAHREDGDPRWERMRRRWLDAARTEGAGAPPAAEAVQDAPADQATLLTQLTSALLGPDAAADGAAALAGLDGTDTAGDAGTDGASRTGTEGGTTDGGAGSGRPSEGASGASSGGGAADDGYLDRARAVAARRGRPDADDSPAPAGSAATSASGAPAAGGDAAKPAPLREEGGYQVPSPFLRAALARLATSGGGEGGGGPVGS
jgi:hypothetical protein